MFKAPAGFFRTTGGLLRFPQECFVCGESAEKEYPIRRIQFTAFYLVVVKYRTMKINVPICRKHYWQMTLMKICLWASLIIGPVVLAISSDTVGHTEKIFWGILLINIIGMYVYLSMKNNFKIYTIGGNENVFSVKKEKYLKRLIEINSEIELTLPDPLVPWF